MPTQVNPALLKKATRGFEKVLDAEGDQGRSECARKDAFFHGHIADPCPTREQPGKREEWIRT